MSCNLPPQTIQGYVANWSGGIKSKLSSITEFQSIPIPYQYQYHTIPYHTIPYHSIPIPIPIPIPYHTIIAPKKKVEVNRGDNNFYIFAKPTMDN
jgi:hypothetical protein